MRGVLPSQRLIGRCVGVTSRLFDVMDLVNLRVESEKKAAQRLR
jgi:hypothetical protein